MSQPDQVVPLDVRNKAILELLYASGLRNTELRNLSVYDVDLAQLQLSVRKGKNQKDRLIPIGEIAAENIERYIKYVRGDLCSNYSKHILFLSKSGKKITRGNLIWIISKYSKMACLGSSVTPHTFRHSCATHMLRNGATLDTFRSYWGMHRWRQHIYTRVIITDLQKCIS
jgi:integrase/recombinase XerD